MFCQNVLEKETQLLFAQRELNIYKKQLESAETTKARACSELEMAKVTLKDLTTKLKTVNEAKQSAMEAAEAVKKQAKQLELAKSQKHLGSAAHKLELDQAREEYRTIASELDAAKQQLNKIRQDFDAALEVKWASFQQAAEAQRAANTNSERVSELSKEILAMQESEQQLKLASAQALERQAKNVAEKDAHVEACRIAKEEAKKNYESLKKEYEPELTRNLEVKLAETTTEIELLQEEMKKVHASEMDSVKVITFELNEATKALQKVAEEESSLRNMVTFLRLELENVKREQVELLAKDAEIESLASGKEHGALVDHSSTLELLSSETENARQEAEEVNKNAEELKQEAENAKLLAAQLEKKLELALKDGEAAKAAEKKVYDEMTIVSEGKNLEDHNSNNKIKISLEEFESLKKKTEEYQNMAKTKEADAIAQVEAINARKDEAERKLEANLKAIEEIRQATEMALNSAQMAEAAQNMVEGELQRWRQNEEMMET